MDWKRIHNAHATAAGCPCPECKKRIDWLAGRLLGILDSHGQPEEVSRILEKQLDTDKPRCTLPS